MKTKSIIIFFVVVVLILHNVTNAQVQVWQRVYFYSQTNSFREVIQTFDGGYILAGHIADQTMKIHLMKLDSLGLREWENVIGEPGVYMTLASIKQTKDSGFVMTGYYGNGCSIVKTDKTGNFKWLKSFNLGSDSRTDQILITNQGQHFLLCGTAHFFSSNSSKSFLLKTDSLGNQLYQKYYGDSTFTDALNVYQIPNSKELLFTNITRSSIGSPYYGKIYKSTENGDVIWKNTIGMNLGGRPILYNNGIYLYGQDPEKLMLIKLDEFGNLIWHNQIQTEFTLQKGCVNNNYEFVLGGRLYVNGKSDFSFILADTLGTFQNPSFISTPKNSNNYFSDLKVTSDRGYIMIGSTDYTTTDGFPNNSLIVKTDSSFNTTPVVNISSNEEIEADNYSVMYQNYPNPFNPETTIQFRLDKLKYVKIEIYDITGKRIKILVNDYKTKGNYKVTFNAASLSSGIYYCSLYLDTKLKDVKKMIFLK